MKKKHLKKRGWFGSISESDSDSLDVVESDGCEESNVVAFDDEGVEIKDNHNSKSNNESKKINKTLKLND